MQHKNKCFWDKLVELGAVADFDTFPEIKRIVDDTREVRDGDLFILRQGAQPLTSDQAEEYIKKAVNAGAVGILVDPQFCGVYSGCPVATLKDPHLHLGKIAEAFYGNPSQSMKMVGVTGTNGKTTTTYLIESLANAMGIKTGVLGTISYRYPGYSEMAPNTTPGTLKLYRLLSEMKNAGCELVAMEVSSHGIVQGRIDGLCFDIAVWTNLGTDHLDFHQTREAYAQAKELLFSRHLARSYQMGKKPAAVVNYDDLEVMEHIQAANPDCWGGRVCTFSACGHESADFALMDSKWNKGTYSFEIADKQGNRRLSSGLPLMGRYNLANAAAAFTVMEQLGFDLDKAAFCLNQVAQIPGRMETVYSRGPQVIVDFAHTPEALENALAAARECVPREGTLRVVFGAGGDRDPSKRPMMGAIAEKIADYVYVTSDNPRTEDPQKIITQVVGGMKSLEKARIESDRKTAIELALRESSPHDVVLIAGKGHEDYQILGTQKIHFDDREIARNYFTPLSD